MVAHYKLQEPKNDRESLVIAFDLERRVEGQTLQYLQISSHTLEQSSPRSNLCILKGALICITLINSKISYIGNRPNLIKTSNLAFAWSSCGRQEHNA